MLKDYSFKKVYIACGYTDLRGGIEKLSSLIEIEYDLDPFDEGTLFLFCGRKLDRVKGLLWEGDGFLVLYKRLENGKYMWPRNITEMKSLSHEQYRLLVTGFSIESSIKRVSPQRAV